MIIEEKAHIGGGMEGWVAKWYAHNTRKDMTEFEALAERFSREWPRESRILEVAPGPGFLAVELAKRGYAVTGLDISRTFVEMARDGARRESVAVDFQHGNASAMPFDDGVFDFIVCRAAFKNFARPEKALNEMHRVLKPGGRVLIIDLRKDASLDDISRYAQRPEIGWINGFIIKWTFRLMLIPRAYTVEAFRELAGRSKFGGCEIATASIGMEISLTNRSCYDCHSAK